MCARVSDYVSVHVCERMVCVYIYICVCRCMYIQKRKKRKTREVYTHAWWTKLNEDAPWWRAFNKICFWHPTTPRNGKPRLTLFLFINHVYAHPRRRPTSSRAYAYARLHLTIYYLQYNWERILFRLIPRSNSRYYSVCAKTCPIWNSLRCGLYASS